MFGSLFRDIVIRRFDSDKQTLQQIPVPISYSPKQKWYSLLAKPPADPNQGAIAVQLPRIGFELTNIQRDPSRKLNGINQIIQLVDDKNKMLTQFVPIPYKLSFELYIMAKNTDDALQIIEQIIPFFNPDFNCTLNLIPEFDYKYDIRVNLDDIQKQDVYDGDFQQRRVLTYSLPFTVEGWFFGPQETVGVIKRVQIDFQVLAGSDPITPELIEQSYRNARIVVMPGLTANGQSTSVLSQSIPWKDIDAEDDYGFITETFEYSDGKVFNPVLLKDVINPNAKDT